MNDLIVLKALSSLQLSRVGRHHEAFDELDELATELPGLRAYVAQQGHIPTDISSGPLGDLVQGWSHYYQARYAEAFESFGDASTVDAPWLKAYAMLGKGKVCTDLGFFADAARWCAEASCLARRYEHDEIVAAAHGARGEILLRADHPRLAIEAYTLDTALLPASDRFRGRVMCYQAHAYSRLGAHAAATLAYRTSAQEQGEKTAPYAFAGLAMLGAETENYGLIHEALRHADLLDSPIHDGVGWIYVARSRYAQLQGEDTQRWCELARNHLPNEYIFEHQWLARWTKTLGHQVESMPSTPVSLRSFRPHPPDKLEETGIEFDSDPIDVKLFNDGLVNVEWSHDVNALWNQRRHYFLP